MNLMHPWRPRTQCTLSHRSWRAFAFFSIQNKCFTPPRPSAVFTQIPSQVERRRMSSEKMVAAGPSGHLSVRGRLSASTRFCAVEQQGGGKRWFVVRKGGPSSSVERRVLMLDIEEVREVNAHEFELVGGHTAASFRLAFRVTSEAGVQPPHHHAQPTPPVPRSHTHPCTTPRAIQVGGGAPVHCRPSSLV